MKSGEDKSETLPTCDPTKSSSISKRTYDDLEQVKQWFLEGHSPPEIRAALAEFHGISRGQADKLIEKTLDNFAEVGAADPAVLRGWGLEALRHLYAKMCEIGDYANAAKTVKMLLQIHK